MDTYRHFEMNAKKKKFEEEAAKHETKVAWHFQLLFWGIVIGICLLIMWIASLVI